MAKKRKKKKKSKNKIGFRMYLSITCALAGMIFYLPITFLLVIGMLPTFVAAAVDTGVGRNKTLTVGAMNFAGCFPYLIDILTHAGVMDDTMRLLSDPMTIIIIYGSAAIGYAINWLVTMTVASVLVQKSKSRLKKIEDEKMALETRWGKKVNGKYDLDPSGFIIEKDAEDVAD